MKQKFILLSIVFLGTLHLNSVNCCQKLNWNLFRQTGENDINHLQGKDVIILSLEKVVDTTSKFWAKYQSKCDKWMLIKNKIASIFLLSEKIDGHKAHYFFEVLPCSYRGELIINKKKAKFIVNAGALSEIKYSDTTIFYGYLKADFKKFFITGAGME